MPLPLTVSCFSKIQIGFAFLVPAYPGSPGQRAVKRVYVCMYVCVCIYLSIYPFFLVSGGSTDWFVVCSPLTEVGACVDAERCRRPSPLRQVFYAWELICNPRHNRGIPSQCLTDPPQHLSALGGVQRDRATRCVKCSTPGSSSVTPATTAVYLPSVSVKYL